MKRLLVLAALLPLAGCAPDIKALSSDPATLSVHQIVAAPGWTITTDVTRVNSTNTAASANGSGASVNVPQGAVVNPAPGNPVAGVTTAPAPQAPNGATLSPE